MSTVTRQQVKIYRPPTTRWPSPPLKVLGDYDQPVAFGCRKDAPERFFRLYDLAQNRFHEVDIEKGPQLVWIESTRARNQQRRPLAIAPI